MAQYEHLNLVRLPETFVRRKHGGGSPPPDRDLSGHSSKLQTELDAAIDVQRQRRKAEFVDPSLILRVHMTGTPMEEDWNRLGLTVLSTDDDRTLILFASTDDMTEFRARLEAYQGGAPENQKHPPFNVFIGTIEQIGSVEPEDRIGRRFREDGLTEPANFVENSSYLIDLELWDLGDRRLREQKLEKIAEYVEARDGEVFDRYVGPSISMLRLRVSGELVKTLLTVEDVASIDQPPQPDLTTAEAIELTLEDTPALNTVAGEAPIIGIIDSGVNAHPLLEGVLVDAIGVPASLGTADEWGHGTRVSGVALFGDLRAQLAAGTLDRGSRLCSAKVVNDQGRFEDKRLVPSQMREAITTLNARTGCRIFVIALADRKHPYDGGKVGTWAATIDELARELDVLIIVSSGNRSPRSGNRIEQAVSQYPSYLMESGNRFFEPAGALNVITVGAIAHGNGIDGTLADDVRVRPITLEYEPSPFSRIGPGIGGSVKPDLVDVGGTMVFDPIVARLRTGDDLASAGVITLHNRFVDRLFTAGSGTSYAAPRVAFSAAQILTRFPNASGNLLRALLVGAAEVPNAARERLIPLGLDAVSAVCGHGQADLERAAFSSDARIVLYAEDELEVDHFAVYRIPVPRPFQSEAGERRIQVTIAFDPPVRHTRNDYAGVGMSFRLIRGCDPQLIFDHYRKRSKEEGPFPEIEGRYDCTMLPGARVRERGTVQRATATFKRSIETYGNDYYLVVRCESGWAGLDITQRFAAVVEISHSAELQLYELVRQRIRV